MKAWFCIPSARPAAEANLALHKWRDAGYGVALWLDRDDVAVPFCNLYLQGAYPGYAQAVNVLAANVLRMDPGAEWIIDGGDDTEPDPAHSPERIAAECVDHFRGTFGVMQPTGDRWAGGSIDRIAGSAWMGRDWCQRANGGRGPLWPEFTHMFVDQCLQEVAERCGVFWQRRDLVHNHRHFSRQDASVARDRQPPPHLVKWNTPAHWSEMQAVFDRMKRADFVPCMPLPQGNMARGSA